jgi:hypothetical protein
MPQDPWSTTRLDPALEEALNVLARVIQQACGVCGERGAARLKRAVQGDDGLEVGLGEVDDYTLESGALSAYRDGLLLLAYYERAELLGEGVGRVASARLTVDPWACPTPSIDEARAQARRRLAK